MPYFSAQPSTSLGASLRNLFAGGGGVSPMDEMKVGALAAQQAQRMSLAEKARLEAEGIRAHQAAMKDPALATRYASNAAGINEPDGSRLSDSIRGILEQPSGADYEDNSNVQPYPTQAPPSVTRGQRRVFQSAIASTIANQIASGKTNAAQMAQAGGRLQDQNLTEEAIAAPTVPMRNAVIAAMSGRQQQPFTSGPSGIIVNREVGTSDASGALPQSAIRRAAAAASASNAAAGASSARRDYTAGPLTDLARKRRDVAGAPRAANETEAQRRNRLALASKSEQAAFKLMRERSEGEFRLEAKVDPRLKGAKLGAYNPEDDSFAVISPEGKVVAKYRLSKRAGAAAPAPEPAVDDEED